MLSARAKFQERQRKLQEPTAGLGGRPSSSNKQVADSDPVVLHSFKKLATDRPLSILKTASEAADFCVSPRRPHVIRMGKNVMKVIWPEKADREKMEKCLNDFQEDFASCDRQKAQSGLPLCPICAQCSLPVCYVVIGLRAVVVPLTGAHLADFI